MQFIAVSIVAGLLWFQRAQGDTILSATDTAAACFFELVRPHLLIVSPQHCSARCQPALMHVPMRNALAVDQTAHKLQPLWRAAATPGMRTVSLCLREILPRSAQRI